MARGQRIAAAVAGIAAILLASLTLTGAVRADEGETTAAAPQALHPTQVIAEIPDGYNELFPLQWGGGSLYQLKARLATMGCIANTIWNYDGDAWHVYNQYNVPSTLNAEWLAAYEDFVPAGTLYADCFDICEFNYFEAPRSRPCEPVETALAREQAGGGYGLPPTDAECTASWGSRAMAHVLPSMAVYPGTCVIRRGQERFDYRGSALGYITWAFSRIGGAIYPFSPAFVVLEVALDLDDFFGPHQPVPEFHDFNTEFHELCHSNQQFHFAQEMQPDRPVRTSSDAPFIWLTTTAGSAFRDLTGFVQDADGEWSLPDDTYERVYSINPIELAAELCTLYFADRIGEAGLYFADHGNLSPQGSVESDLERYLTPDIVEWIETWIALPEIPAPETEEAATGSASDAQSQ